MAAWMSRPKFRKLAAVAIFAAAVLLQIFFQNIPYPLQVEEHDATKTAAGSLSTSEVVISGATVGSKREFLSYEGSAGETADLDFTNATLGPETASLLGAFPPAPSAGTAAWSFVNHDNEADSGGGEACRTFLHVQAQEADRAAEYHLLQTGEPGLARFRQLQIKTDDAPLVVTIKTEYPPSRPKHAAGCHKRLQSGAWFRGIVNTPIVFVAQPHSTLRITFVPLGNQPSWGGADGFLSTAWLGPLLARKVTVRPIQDDGATMKGTTALSITSFREPLVLKDLQAGSESLRLTVRGRGWVRKDGSIMGIDLLEAMQKTPLLAPLLASANLLLMGWLKRLFFGGKATREAGEPALERSA
jgi:hypothetical protein